VFNVTKGVLVEYSVSIPPLALVFGLNPQSITRSRTINLPAGHAPGTRGGYDFAAPTETARVAQGVTPKPEEFSVEILLDATDRMNDGDPVAAQYGIEPELDTLRTMVEPKAQGPDGVQMLASLGLGRERGFQCCESASVLLFIWGSHVLPVFLTSVRVEEKEYLPNLIPYRANATLSMRVIEGHNPFYSVEKIRQVLSAGRNAGQTTASVLGGLI
jgi:hypothetical protein